MKHQLTIGSPWRLRIWIYLLTMQFMFAVHAQDMRDEALLVLKPYVLSEASWALQQKAISITEFVCPRSAGGKHDFYSEGDYWWPDPSNPDGPYVQRDGMTNPDNFVDHRKAMIRLSRIMGALGSAYVITKDDQYVNASIPHLRAWFVDTATRMNPSLNYAQAIKGRVTGRGIGIIDTIHLMEVAQTLMLFMNSNSMPPTLVRDVRSWFGDYLMWLTSHPYGKDEMNAENNHGTCWVSQVSCFAKLVQNDSLLALCRDRYKSILLPNQMDSAGRFPRELRRTKPYGYSLFNLDAMIMICQILTDKEHDLWHYKTSDGRSIKQGIAYMFPYVKNKETWPFKPDVMYWDNWPVAHPFLIFGAAAFQERSWYDTWVRLDHDPKVDEVVRNLPIRHPLLWMNDDNQITKR